MDRRCGSGASSNYGTMSGKCSRLQQGEGNTSVLTMKPSVEEMTSSFYLENRRVGLANRTFPDGG